MTLEFDSTNNNTAMGNALGQALGNTKGAHGQPEQPQGGLGSSNPFGFGGVTLTPGRMAYAPIRNAMGSESYIKLSKELKEMVKDHNRQNALDIKVLELDRNVDPNLHFASFVFCVQSNTDKSLGVGYNIVMLEATGEPLADMTETINGEPIVIPSYSERALDNRLIEIATGLMQQVYGRDVIFHRSDAQVIPVDFDYEDRQAVEALASNAAAAATSSLVMLAAGGKYFQDLDLIKELKNRSGDAGDADMTFVYNFNPQKVTDFLKLPTRASIVVQAATGYRKSNRNASVNSGSGPKTISEACGYIELMPVLPRFAQQQYNPMYPQMAAMQPITQRLAPVLVLTSVKTNFALTPGAVLLNALVAADLNRGHGWVSAFNTKAGTKVGGVDLTDVTAITADMPSMTDPNVSETRPPVPAGGLTTDMLMKFLGMYCQPDLSIAMDIPVASHNTWYLSLFAEAAKGTAAAEKFIMKSMDELLGKKFVTSLPANVRMFATTPMLIERGYWDDGSGNGRRDIAEIDYVAVCNYADANNNKPLIEKWTNSFLQTSRPSATRLQERREIIQEITGRRATFTGRSVRVFWNGAWLGHALQALQAAGITTSADGRGIFGFGGARANADFLQGAALPTGAGWASSMNTGSNGQMFGGFTSSPWSNGL